MIDLYARVGDSISKFNEPKSLEDDSWVGMNSDDLDTIETCANALEVFHLPPIAGGSLDQPSTLLQDMFMFYAVKARLLYEQRQAEGDEFNPDNPQRKPQPIIDPSEMVTESLFD